MHVTKTYCIISVAQNLRFINIIAEKRRKDCTLYAMHKIDGKEMYNINR